VSRPQKNTRAKIDAVYGPVGDLGTAIVSAAFNTYQNLAQVFGFRVQGTPSEPQMLTFYEFLYFYSHIMLRTAAAKGFTQPQIEKLQGYLGPLLASTAVDSFIGHWPDDFRKRLRRDFYNGLNIAEQEYSQCRGLLSPDDPLNEDTLVGRLARNIADLWERSSNEPAKVAVATAVLKAFPAMQLDRLIAKVASVIDSVDVEGIREFLER